MIVRELIEKLKEFNPETAVLFDGDLEHAACEYTPAGTIASKCIVLNGKQLLDVDYAKLVNLSDNKHVDVVVITE